MGNELEGKGYIHATHQDMSKFDSRRETGYRRVADVIQDFVAKAAKAVEGKGLPRSIPTAGKYTINPIQTHTTRSHLWKNYVGNF